jgi:putative transposase
MLNSEKIISSSKDVREVKRAIAVQMVSAGLKLREASEILKVSDAFVSKWKIIYEKEGAEGLLLKYKGSKGCLSAEKRKEIIGYIEKCDNISAEKLRDYIEEHYGVVYKSKQSYYDLLKAAGKSWHKSQKKNPKKNEERVILRREEIKKNWQNMRKK